MRDVNVGMVGLGTVGGCTLPAMVGAVPRVAVRVRLVGAGEDVGVEE